MKIKGVKTIEEYKQVQKERIQAWVDNNFISGAVTWEMHGANEIKLVDQTGDSMVISLSQID